MEITAENKQQVTLVLEIQRKGELTLVRGYSKRPTKGKEDKELSSTEIESYMIFMGKVTAQTLEVHVQRIWVR